MPTPPAVFITGCSSGIGLAAAREMRDRGWTVWASARKQEDLDRLREEHVHPLQLDVADPDAVAAAANTLRAECGGRLRGVVNNAGFGQPGALEDLDRDHLRRQFEVNVFGLMDLTNRLLPDMIDCGQGRVVHVSSVVGRVALPFMGIYSASKFAVEALADAQRVELHGTGVHISLIEPGPITTRFSRNAVQSGAPALEGGGSRFASLYRRELARRSDREAPKPFALPPEAVARKIAHALTSSHPRRRYAVTLPAHLGALMSRLAPDALLDFILSRELRHRLRAGEDK